MTPGLIKAAPAPASTRQSALFDNSAAQLGRRTAESAALSLTARWVRVGAQMATFIVLARFLAPADFGLVGLMLPFVALVAVVGDLGLSAATVQSKSVSAGQSSALFYAGLAAGSAIALAFAIASPFIALFYDEPRAALIGILLGLSFPLTGLAGQHQALLQRSLNFRVLLIADVVSALASNLLAIGVALAGWGYWALVVRALAGPALYAALLWGLSGWVPGRPDWGDQTRKMMGFGGYNFGFNLLNTSGRQLDNVLIGWRWGEAALGPYALAYRLFFMPVQQVTQPIGSVMVPALSKLRDDPKRYRHWYVGALRAFAFVGAPPLIVVAVAAQDIVILLVGPKWLAAVEILRWLAPVGAIHVAYTSIGWLNLSMGRAKRYFQWALIAVPVCLASFFIGLPWGAAGVAQAYFWANLLLVVPGVFWACHRSPVRPLDFARATWPAAIACAGAGAITGALEVGLADQSTLIRLSAIVAVSGVGLLAFLPLAIDFALVRQLFTRRPNLAA